MYSFSCARCGTPIETELVALTCPSCGVLIELWWNGKPPQRDEVTK